MLEYYCGTHCVYLNKLVNSKLVFSLLCWNPKSANNVPNRRHGLRTSGLNDNQLGKSKLRLN